MKTNDNKIIRNDYIKVGGTSLVGFIETSYDKLVKCFGEPIETDGYKTSTEWTLSFNDIPFTIYDYKETNLYSSDLPSVDEFRKLPSYEWHVGSRNISETKKILFFDKLREMLNEV